MVCAIWDISHVFFSQEDKVLVITHTVSQPCKIPISILCPLFWLFYALLATVFVNLYLL